MHRKVDTKTLNKLFSDSLPTDYKHWYLSVKNTEVHDGTLNVITAITLELGMEQIWNQHIRIV